jgi:acyl transferase domain-containing protein
MKAIRRVSVNSFGFGGSNAHVVLDDAYNFLRDRNLAGKHATRQVSPSAEGIRENCSPHSEQLQQRELINGDKPQINGVSSKSLSKMMFVLSDPDENGLKQFAKTYLDAISPTENSKQLQNLSFTLPL